MVMQGDGDAMQSRVMWLVSEREAGTWDPGETELLCLCAVLSADPFNNCVYVTGIRGTSRPSTSGGQVNDWSEEMVVGIKTKYF
jgi:hypothetical protein